MFDVDAERRVKRENRPDKTMSRFALSRLTMIIYTDFRRTQLLEAS